MNNSHWEERYPPYYPLREPKVIPLYHQTNPVRVPVELLLADNLANALGAGISGLGTGKEHLKSPHPVNRVPACLGGVNHKVLLLMVDKRQLSLEQIKRFFMGTTLEVLQPVQLPIAVARELGFSYPLMLLPKAYTLYQDGPFFHHFLEFELVVK